MPAGRPTKYDPSYCDTVIRMGAQGITKAGMALELGITKSTLWLWTKEHPEFSNAMKEAEQGMEEHFRDLFQRQAEGECKGSTTAAIFLAKNMLPDVFRDRHEHEVKAEIGVFEISYEGANYGEGQEG